MKRQCSLVRGYLLWRGSCPATIRRATAENLGKCYLNNNAPANTRIRQCRTTLKRYYHPPSSSSSSFYKTTITMKFFILSGIFFCPGQQSLHTKLSSAPKSNGVRPNDEFIPGFFYKCVRYACCAGFFRFTETQDEKLE